MIRILPPPRERAEELYDAVSKVFSHGGYYRFLHFCREAYFEGSCYDGQASRVAEADGTIVSHAGVWRYRMRVGRARLCTGGIGAVCTLDDHRRRGLASRVMRAVVRAMRAGGYDYSMLFGRRDFYDRFGYVQAWPTTTVSVRVEDLPAEPLKLTLRKVPLTEATCGRGAVMRIYERESAARTGSAERPLYAGVGGLWLDAQCRALANGRGAVRGYVVTSVSGDELVVQEAGGLGRSCGVGQLLAALRRLALRAKRRRIRTEGLSWSHPLCAALRQGTCDANMHYLRSGGAMALVIDLRGCLQAMREELTDRLRASPMRRFRGALSIAGAGETVALRIAGGKVRVAPGRVRTPNRILAGRSAGRLLIGSEAPSVLAGQGQVRFRGAAAELAEALFPPQWPMLGALDHY